MAAQNYEELKAEVLRLRAEGKLPRKPDSSHRADWAYGNTVIENSAVTREMADRAASKPTKRD